MILHAGLVALRLGGRWRGALISGPSGAGKSDLALRALDAGFRLVADDRTVVWTSGGVVFGRAPAPLIGLIEARSLDVVREPSLDLAEVVLVAACAEPPHAPERLREPEVEMIAGTAVPRFFLDPREPSAPAKLRRAMQHLGAAA